MIRDILEDHGGGISSMRVIALVPTLVVCVGWLAMVTARVIVAVKTGSAAELPSISLEISGFCLGAAGLKVWQRQMEKPADPAPAPLVA